MTEDEFVAGYALLVTRRSVPPEKWLQYVGHTQNSHIRYLVLDRSTNIGNIREKWQIENSPLAKALR